MRWTKVLTVGAVASLGLVAACGAPSTNGTGTGNASGDNGKVEGAAATLDPTAKGPAPAVPGAKKGGTLTVSYSSTPANMDPSDQFYQDTAVIFSLGHRALTTFASRDGQQVLVPDLATDLGKASEDGLTWTFTLKDGVKFEDGTPVKAADIVWAAKRSFDPDLAANGPTYQREFFKGGAEYQGPYKGDKNWKGVEATDDKTDRLPPREALRDAALLRLVQPVHADPRGEGHEGRLPAAPAGHRPLHVRQVHPGHRADAQAQPQLGPRHRPGAQRLPRRLPLQVGPGRRQDADRRARLQR